MHPSINNNIEEDDAGEMRHKVSEKKLMVGNKSKSHLAWPRSYSIVYSTFLEVGEKPRDVVLAFHYLPFI